MHSIVRRFIKTGVVFLALGLALGLYMLARRELLGIWPHPYLVSAHAHAVLVGFVMFLILGVALWIFPRPRKGDKQYRPEYAEIVYWTLLLSTCLRFLFELLRAWATPPWFGWVVFLAGLGQTIGLVFFFVTMWPRIRAAGSKMREATGERF